MPQEEQLTHRPSGGLAVAGILVADTLEEGPGIVHLAGMIAGVATNQI